MQMQTKYMEIVPLNKNKKKGNYKLFEWTKMQVCLDMFMPLSKGNAQQKHLP